MGAQGLSCWSHRKSPKLIFACSETGEFPCPTQPCFILYLKTVHYPALTASSTVLSEFPVSLMAASSSSWMPTSCFFLHSMGALGSGYSDAVRERDSVSSPWGRGLTVLWQPCWRGHTCTCPWELPALGILGAGGMWVCGGLLLPFPTHLDVHPGGI